MHIKVKSGRRSAILNLTKFKFFMVCPYRNQHILFDSNVLAIWLGFPDITDIRKRWQIIGCHDLVSVRILPYFELIRVISEMNINF